MATTFTNNFFYKKNISKNIAFINYKIPTLVKRKNTRVYNVVLESGHKMIVNNMLVETLQPSNKLYKQKLLK